MKNWDWRAEVDNLLRDRKSDFSDIFLTGNASPQDYFKYGKSTKKVPFYISWYVVAELADLWSVFRVLSKFQLTNWTNRTILIFPLLRFYLGISFPLNDRVLFQKEIKRRAINMNTTSNDRIPQRIFSPKCSSMLRPTFMFPAKMHFPRTRWRSSAFDRPERSKCCLMEALWCSP